MISEDTLNVVYKYLQEECMATSTWKNYKRDIKGRKPYGVRVVSLISKATKRLTTTEPIGTSIPEDKILDTAKDIIIERLQQIQSNRERRTTPKKSSTDKNYARVSDIYKQIYNAISRTLLYLHSDTKGDSI